MNTSFAVRRTLGVLLAATALVTVAAGTTGCSIVSGSASPAPQPQAQPAAASPAAAPVAEQSAAVGASAPSKATASTVKSVSSGKLVGASAGRGKAVVQQNCLTGCHGDRLLRYRASQASARRIVAAMAPKANLAQAQQAAVVSYFAQ
jgi:hypothetical protein